MLKFVDLGGLGADDFAADRAIGLFDGFAFLGAGGRIDHGAGIQGMGRFVADGLATLVQADVPMLGGAGRPFGRVTMAGGLDDVGPFRGDESAFEAERGDVDDFAGLFAGRGGGMVQGNLGVDDFGMGRV